MKVTRLSRPGTSPGPGQRPSGSECNRRAFSVAFVSRYLEPLRYQSNTRRPRPNYPPKLGINGDALPVPLVYDIVTDNAKATSVIASVATSVTARLTLPVVVV